MSPSLDNQKLIKYAKQNDVDSRRNVFTKGNFKYPDANQLCKIAINFNTRSKDHVDNIRY